jgi:protein TonB
MAFEALLQQPDSKPFRWRRIAIGVSLALHGVALAVGVVKSVWEVAEMPLPSIHVTLAEAPPPPPPPPPPAGGKKTTNKPKTRAQPKEIVQPKDSKDDKKEEPEEEEQEAEEANGQPGGEKGGVEGGVVGGVGTGAPPPPKQSGPKAVSAGIGTRQLLVNPAVAPYCCPKIPRALERTSSFTSHLRVCVTASGQVYDVKILKGAGPAIDSQIPAFVRRWRYRPMVVDGEARAFCYPVTYQISQR